MNITLQGITRKGKNRVRENGADWIVLIEQDSVMCLSGAPGFLIIPANGNQKATRWIAKQHDLDFEIVTK
jgi:hypothetical protein